MKPKYNINFQIDDLLVKRDVQEVLDIPPCPKCGEFILPDGYCECNVRDIHD